MDTAPCAKARRKRAEVIKLSCILRVEYCVLCSTVAALYDDNYFRKAILHSPTSIRKAFLEWIAIIRRRTTDGRECANNAGTRFEAFINSAIN